MSQAPANIFTARPVQVLDPVTAGASQAAQGLMTTSAALGEGQRDRDSRESIAAAEIAGRAGTAMAGIESNERIATRSQGLRAQEIAAAREQGEADVALREQAGERDAERLDMQRTRDANDQRLTELQVRLEQERLDFDRAVATSKGRATKQAMERLLVTQDEMAAVSEQAMILETAMSEENQAIRAALLTGRFSRMSEDELKAEEALTETMGAAIDAAGRERYFAEGVSERGFWKDAARWGRRVLADGGPGFDPDPIVDEIPEIDSMFAFDPATLATILNSADAPSLAEVRESAEGYVPDVIDRLVSEGELTEDQARRVFDLTVLGVARGFAATGNDDEILIRTRPRNLGVIQGPLGPAGGGTAQAMNAGTRAAMMAGAGVGSSNERAEALSDQVEVAKRALGDGPEGEVITRTAARILRSMSGVLDTGAAVATAMDQQAPEDKGFFGIPKSNRDEIADGYSRLSGAYLAGANSIMLQEDREALESRANRAKQYEQAMLAALNENPGDALAEAEEILSDPNTGPDLRREVLDMIGSITSLQTMAQEVEGLGRRTAELGRQAEQYDTLLQSGNIDGLLDAIENDGSAEAFREFFDVEEITIPDATGGG